MELGLSSATDVLVSGCSAGGLAAMLSARGIERVRRHTGVIGQLIPSVRESTATAFVYHTRC